MSDFTVIYDHEPEDDNILIAFKVGEHLRHFSLTRAAIEHSTNERPKTINEMEEILRRHFDRLRPYLERIAQRDWSNVIIVMRELLPKFERPRVEH